MTIATRPSTIAVSTFIAMYAAGRSGVRRSCRLQPRLRSTATAAPPAVVPTIAPYTAMLISMYDWIDSPPWLPPPLDAGT